LDDEQSSGAEVLFVWRRLLTAYLLLSPPTFVEMSHATKRSCESDSDTFYSVAATTWLLSPPRSATWSIVKFTVRVATAPSPYHMTSICSWLGN